MKSNGQVATICAALLVLAAAVLFSGSPMKAQAANAGVGLAAVTSVSQCPPLVTNPAPGLATFCPVISTTPGVTGIYLQYNGQPYVQLGGVQPQAGVASFNGRSGVVVSTAGDYSYSQLAGSAPVLANCPAGTAGPAGLTFNNAQTPCK